MFAKRLLEESGEASFDYKDEDKITLSDGCYSLGQVRVVFHVFLWLVWGYVTSVEFRNSNSNVMIFVNCIDTIKPGKLLLYFSISECYEERCTLWRM